MKTTLPLLTCLLLIVTPVLADETASTIEATTSKGDLVKLHPNGRWEFVDNEKAQKAAALAQTYPENQVCPPGAQGKFLGFGRCILPGDKEFNRGSLSGKGR